MQDKIGSPNPDWDSSELAKEKTTVTSLDKMAALIAYLNVLDADNKEWIDDNIGIPAHLIGEPQGISDTTKKRISFKTGDIIDADNLK